MRLVAMPPKQLDKDGLTHYSEVDGITIRERFFGENYSQLESPKWKGPIVVQKISEESTLWHCRTDGWQLPPEVQGVLYTTQNEAISAIVTFVPH